MSGSASSKTDTTQDTSVQLTEQRVREIVKEELAAAKPLRKTRKGPPSLLSKRHKTPNIPAPNKS